MKTQKDIFLSEEADSYFDRNDRAGSVHHNLAYYGFLSDYLAPGSKVLEIGCSAGDNAPLFLKKPGVEYHGIDPSSKAIEEARRRYPEANFQVGTADALPFADMTFDFIYLGFFLYVADRALLSKIVFETDRSLKPNGLLALTDFSPAQAMTKSYSHHAGLKTYKFSYEKLFESLPQYCLLEKRLHFQGELPRDPDQWVATFLLFKSFDLIRDPSSQSRDCHGE